MQPCIQPIHTTHAYNCACNHACNTCMQLMHTTMHTTLVHAYNMHTTHACNAYIRFISYNEVGSNDTTSTVGSNCFLLISEEIAFYQGNKKEQSIIYSSLQRLVRVIDVSLISCTYVSDLF